MEETTEITELVLDWMKKTYEKFETKGNYNGSPDNGNAVRNQLMYFQNFLIKWN